MGFGMSPKVFFPCFNLGTKICVCIVWVHQLEAHDLPYRTWKLHIKTGGISTGPEAKVFGHSLQFIWRFESNIKKIIFCLREERRMSIIIRCLKFLVYQMTFPIGYCLLL